MFQQCKSKCNLCCQCNCTKTFISTVDSFTTSRMDFIAKSHTNDLRCDTNIFLFHSRVKMVRLPSTWQPSTGGFLGLKQSLRMVSSSKNSASLTLFLMLDCKTQTASQRNTRKVLSFFFFFLKVLRLTVKTRMEIHHCTLQLDTDTSSSSTPSSPTELTRLSKWACLPFFSNCSNFTHCGISACSNLSKA